MTQAPSCETCGGSREVRKPHTVATLMPCPDCQPKQVDDNPPIGALARAIEELQPKPSEGAVSEARVIELREDMGHPCRGNQWDGEYAKDWRSMCDELLTARATIERQAGEIEAMREAIGVAARKSIDRISQLESDLAAARLNAFDKAVADELPRVSNVEYNSHEICKHFAAKVRERMAAGDGK